MRNRESRCKGMLQVPPKGNAVSPAEGKCCKSRRREISEANREPKRIGKRSESGAEAGTISKGAPGREKAMAGGRRIRLWAAGWRDFVKSQALTYSWCADVFLVSLDVFSVSQRVFSVPRPDVFSVSPNLSAKSFPSTL